MSDVKTSQFESDDDDEDIFRAAFSTPGQKAQSSGKIKIGGSQEGSLDKEKCDPPKDENEGFRSYGSKNQRTFSDTSQESRPANISDYMRKANSVDAGPNSFMTDEYLSSPDEVEEEEGDDKFIEIKISDPNRIGEGMSSFMAYRVATRTNLKPFKQNEFSVIRRFSDFLGLHEKLTAKYARRGRIIPPAPEKSLVGTTKVKMASNDESMTGEKAEFITRRRLALERFVNRLAQHPIIRKDTNFVEFIESKRDLPRATSTSALSSASVFRLLERVGDTVNRMTNKMEETDPWYEEKIQHVDNLDSQLRKMYSAVESFQICRHDLSCATSAFGQSLAALSSVEEAHSLSRAIANLAKVEEKVSHVHHMQAEADTFHLFDLFKDYVALIGAIREALNERNKIFQASQYAQFMVLKKKEQRARLEMGGRADKLPNASDEVTEWETKLEESQANFVKISRVIKVEIDFFERYRVRDFKNAIINYLEALMECQAQLVNHWEGFLPEIKNGLY